MTPALSDKLVDCVRTHELIEAASCRGMSRIEERLVLLHLRLRLYVDFRPSADSKNHAKYTTQNTQHNPFS